MSRRVIKVTGKGMLSLLLMLPVATVALEDPTRPPDYRPRTAVVSTPDEPVMQWNLTSILIATDRRLAVINGRPLALGGSIGEARVVSIEVGLVTLDAKGERVRLRLVPTTKKATRTKTRRKP